ncbi:hypothetical protein RF11_13693 [Thelohanellus kitauei]|uniref:Uncharacterized protein n=1 Tax=Thelohanellus kitauei TaxID=669202 RepID=A0A0C2NAC5_THEKT|nr:hypothetical protein RF11_13693 [Thelohanellus kitauei]
MGSFYTFSAKSSVAPCRPQIGKVDAFVIIIGEKLFHEKFFRNQVVFLSMMFCEFITKKRTRPFESAPYPKRSYCSITGYTLFCPLSLMGLQNSSGQAIFAAVLRLFGRQTRMTL